MNKTNLDISKLLKFLNYTCMLLLIAAIFNLISCTGNNTQMIDISFKKEKPKYFGYSGVHLYAVQPTQKINDKEVVVPENTQAATLYRLYNDLAIFLSNKIDPNPKVSNVRTYLSFGNPQNMDSIKTSDDPNKGYHLVGYLNKEDINQLNDFIKSNALEELEGAQKYYEKLNDEVKEELTILLEDRVVNELHSYLKIAIELINKCVSDGSEIVIIYNG